MAAVRVKRLAWGSTGPRQGARPGCGVAPWLRRGPPGAVSWTGLKRGRSSTRLASTGSPHGVHGALGRAVGASGEGWWRRRIPAGLTLGDVAATGRLGVACATGGQRVGLYLSVCLCAKCAGAESCVAGTATGGISRRTTGGRCGPGRGGGVLEHRSRAARCVASMSARTAGHDELAVQSMQRRVYRVACSCGRCY